MLCKAPIAILMAAGLLACACGAPQPDDLALSGAPIAPDTGVAQCQVKKDAERPMLVEWPAVEKASLQATAAKGVVLVRYDGCRLKQLPRCTVNGEYEFVETSRAQDGFIVKNKSELFAKLPLGAVSLEGELSQGNQLSLTYVAVGARTAAVSGISSQGLTGECKGATHFVRTMVVGAYALSTEAAVGGGAGIGVMSAGVGGSHEKSSEVIRRDGNLEDCIDDATPATDKRCQAVVQLILEPLRAETAGATAAADQVGEPAVEQEAPAAAVPAAGSTPAADEVPRVSGPAPLARYRARLSDADHYSTDGKRLRAAAQVIRQDRYNYHVAATRDAEDEGDPVLGAKAKRSRLQDWLAGRIPPGVEQRIMDGTPLVEVSVFENRAEVTLVED